MKLVLAILLAFFALAYAYPSPGADQQETLDTVNVPLLADADSDHVREARGSGPGCCGGGGRGGGGYGGYNGGGGNRGYNGGGGGGGGYGGYSSASASASAQASASSGGYNKYGK
ncbi:uncharacterized protein LOC129245817 [Anastrepha obliqua]|uniref:uncharacterized protein LOC129245817 n=1 Tax=Anastrepha obliqua TaxID=95512 RepID=UPI002409F8CB|nr:uncharacterized protein LOC129245817 [Anastrepha obliqua]